MQGTPKAIQIQGIVRNATVIGAQDGQAEDLINLRFMDGSWRACGDGRLINFTMGAEYTQLYVHTNVYHHLLGVNNGTLYWFAEIGTDGVSFYSLDGTTSRTNWPQDMQSLPTSPVALTTVTSDLDIVQAGHLLSIIGGDVMISALFSTVKNEYIILTLGDAADNTNRRLYPFGEIYFNISKDEELLEDYVPSSCDVKQPSGSSHVCYPEVEATVQQCHDKMVEMFGVMRKKNKFI